MSDNEKSNILVVDDTPANLDLLGKILAAESYAVRTLPDGALALRSALNKPPDLVLLDIKMPHMDGYEVCAQLKADLRTRDIPVIFISALQETEDKIRAFAAGGVDYVSKPFQAEEVLARVRTHLHLRALQQDLLSAKERAEASDRAKSAFLANISHELRTPLNAVLGFAQLMKLDESLGERQRRYIQHILSGSEFLLELINDVLDLAKIEAGRFECVPETWESKIFFEELQALFSARAEQKNLFFHYEESTKLPATLYCDPKRLRQIIMNLLGNAVKFTQQGGVTLRTAFKEGHLIVEVIDTGPGIPVDMREKIFEPFQQAGNTMQNDEGTGLGLPLSRRLAHAMGGDISVACAEGEGSRFRVDIMA